MLATPWKEHRQALSQRKEQVGEQARPGINKFLVSVVSQQVFAGFGHLFPEDSSLP